MAYQGINTGTSPNSGTGDTLLSGAEKINSNFIELFAAVGLGSTGTGVVTDIFAGDNIGVNTSTGEVTISVVGLTTSLVGGEDISIVTNSGVSTISYVGAANTTNIRADSLVVSGISTLTSVIIPDDLTVGQTLVDTLTINAAIGNTVVPEGNNLYDLGFPGINWKKLHVVNVAASSSVTATTYYGDGSNLTGVSGGGIGTTGSVNTTGIITASAFVGDGSGLTGIAHTTDITRTFLDFDGPQQTQAIKATGAVDKKFAIEVGTAITTATIVARFEPNKLTLPSGDLACRNIVGTGGTFNGTTNFNIANVGILTGAREGLVYKLSAGTGLTFEGSIHGHIGGTVGNEWHSSTGTLGIDATVLQTTGSQIILGDKTYTGITTNNKSLQTLESVNALGFTTTTISAGTGINVSGSTGNVTISAVGSGDTANVSTNSLVVSGVTTVTNVETSGNILPDNNGSGFVGSPSTRFGVIAGNVGDFSVLSAGPVSSSSSVTASSFFGDGSNLTGLANTERITAESLVVLGVTTSFGGIVVDRTSVPNNILTAKLGGVTKAQIIASGNAQFASLTATGTLDVAGGTLVTGVTTSSDGFSSGTGGPVQISVVGTTLTFTVNGVGSTSLTLS